MLTGEKNAAGLYRLRAECCYSTLDLMSIYRATRLVGQILHRNRVGVVKIDNDTIFRRAYGGGHTMGTTRMGRSPADSVCDADCRVHGYENLYLAGSSTFTTGGAANPTLTLVALAHRLAVHLAGRKAGRPA
jgi:choline dehydrogenase-like flavoprotein